MDKALIAGAADEAAKLIEKTLENLAKAQADVATAGQRPTPLFFPNGIELIYFKLTFGKDIDITVAVAGEKAKYPGATVGGNAMLVIDANGDAAGEA